MRQIYSYKTLETELSKSWLQTLKVRLIISSPMMNTISLKEPNSFLPNLKSNQENVTTVLLLLTLKLLKVEQQSKTPKMKDKN